jgi:streptogramin lyase
MQSLTADRYGTLISITIVEPVACNSSWNLYAELITPDTKDSPELYQLAKIDSSGVAHAIAGSARGHKDGAAKDAQFWRITAMTCSPKGDVYVADGTPATGSWIRRITVDGTVTTVAGRDKVGLADGKKDAAQFYCPSSLAVDSSGNIWVADPINSRIRKVTPDGTVTTLFGDEAHTDAAHDAFIQPSGIAIDPLGNLYVLDGGQKMARISKVSPDGKHVETLVVVDAKTASRGTASN